MARQLRAARRLEVISSRTSVQFSSDELDLVTKGLHRLMEDPADQEERLDVVRLLRRLEGPTAEAAERERRAS